MSKLTSLIFILLAIIFIFYALLPTPDFPNPPTDAIVSTEPADIETISRRAYFTDYSREEVMAHYIKQFEKSTFNGIGLPTYRLNYPPEEAFTLIRDQTSSTFLEEIVHPFRESLFINGFEPADQTSSIIIEGKKWRQKITVRFVDSNFVTRIILTFLSVFLILLVGRQWIKSLKNA